MTVTTVVTYLDALVAALSAANLGTNVTVYDGQPVTSTPGDFLAVGYSLDDEDTQSTSTSSWMTLGRTLGGDYEIPCTVQVTRGETDAAAARLAAAAILDAAWTAILPAAARPNVTALGVSGVLHARFESIAVRSIKGPKGSTVTIGFVVTVREYAQSA